MLHNSILGGWALFGGAEPTIDPRGDETASLPPFRGPWICTVCKQTSPKRWFANVNTTSYFDVTNSVYSVTKTTIGHCSILEFGRGASNQAVSPGITRPEVAGVTFSHSDSDPVPKFLNPGPAIFQIWESDSCSDSSYYHRSNHILPVFLLKKWPHRALLLLKLISDPGSGSGFSQIFASRSGSGSENKTQNPTGVDSGNPVPVPPLHATAVWNHSRKYH